MENDNIFSEIIKDQIKRVEEITAEKISLFQKQINKQINSIKIISYTVIILNIINTIFSILRVYELSVYSFIGIFINLTGLIIFKKET